MKILADNILVKILQKEKTNTGIIITSKDDTSLHYARVIEVGTLVSAIIQPNKIVCFPQFTARKFKYNDVDLALIQESDVIIVFENECEAGI